jgi:hypothetical protein
VKLCVDDCKLNAAPLGAFHIYIIRCLQKKNKNKIKKKMETLQFWNLHFVKVPVGYVLLLNRKIDPTVLLAFTFVIVYIELLLPVIPKNPLVDVVES